MKKSTQGKKPYECKQCGKCFSKAGNLRSHERVYSGEKAYECKQCGKQFKQAKNLRRHEKGHLHTKKSALKHLRGKSTCLKRTDFQSQSSVDNETCCSELAHMDTGNSSRDYISTLSSTLQDTRSTIFVKKHSCWICQEDMSSEALLLKHYENHMMYVSEDI